METGFTLLLFYYMQVAYRTQERKRVIANQIPAGSDKNGSATQLNERGDVIAVKSEKLNGKSWNVHFDLNKCPKGLYIIKAQSPDGVQTTKIVIH